MPFKSPLDPERLKQILEAEDLLKLEAASKIEIDPEGLGEEGPDNAVAGLPDVDLLLAASPAKSSVAFDPQNFIPFILMTIANKLTGGASRLLMREFGCGVTEWRILAILAIESEALPGRICEATGLDKSSVSRAASSLETRGLVMASADPNHGRRRPVAITPDGRALHDQILLSMIERQDALLEGFSPGERQMLIELLQRLLNNLGGIRWNDDEPTDGGD